MKFHVSNGGLFSSTSINDVQSREYSSVKSSFQQNVFSSGSTNLEFNTDRTARSSCPNKTKRTLKPNKELKMNRSATFLTEEIASECDLSIFLGGSLNKSTRKAYTVLLCLIILNILSLPLTSVLNGLVIITVKTKPRLKTTSNVALACLATADCVMGVIGQPLFAVQLAVLLQGERSSSYCPLLAASVYVIGVLGAATFLHLTVINIERYIAIKHSLKYNSLVTRGRLLRGSAFVWVVSFLLTVPLSFTDNEIYLVVNNMTGCLWVAIVTFCQIVILQETRRLRKRIAAHQISLEDRQKFLKDKRAFQLTTMILFALVLTSLPLFVVRILITNSIIHSLTASYISLMSAVFVAILNSLINPIVYCIRIREFRVALIEILKRYATAQVVEH